MSRGECGRLQRAGSDGPGAWAGTGRSQQAAGGICNAIADPQNAEGKPAIHDLPCLVLWHLCMLVGGSQYHTRLPTLAVYALPLGNIKSLSDQPHSWHCLCCLALSACCAGQNSCNSGCTSAGALGSARDHTEPDRLQRSQCHPCRRIL